MTTKSIITWASLSLLFLSCADNSTGANDSVSSSSPELSVEAFSSSQHASSVQAGSSSSPVSSAANPWSSSISVIATSSSSRVVSSMVQASSSSSAIAMSSSSAISSSSLQALQFLRNQVRVPDGCGTIQWASGPEKTCVTDFWADTTEVTIGAYQGLMGGGIPSLYHNGYYRWPNPSGTGYADDGSLCPTCPAGGLTIYEAMLYANALTKSVLLSNDTVYSYTAIDSADAPGYYLKVKVREAVGLQNLKIDDSKSGFRLPTRGEFHYLCLKSNLLNYPWEDLFLDSTVAWLSIEGYNQFVWSNQNSGQVTHPVASKLGTSWHLYDLLGNADEWTTTPNHDYPGQYMALGGSAELNGYITSDMRMDGNRAGVRLVRGKSVVEKGTK